MKRFIKMIKFEKPIRFNNFDFYSQNKFNFSDTINNENKEIVISRLEKGILYAKQPVDKNKPFYFGKSKAAERRRQAKRLKLTNKSDPSFTGEDPIPTWSEKKGKVMYKFLEQYVNNNSIAGKKIPEDKKKEYVQKKKEFNVWFLDKYRREKHYEENLKTAQFQIHESANYLPEYLKKELISGKATYYERHPYLSEDVNTFKNMRFTEEFLYKEQKERLLPEHSRIILKAIDVIKRDPSIFKQPEQLFDTDVNVEDFTYYDRFGVPLEDDVDRGREKKDEDENKDEEEEENEEDEKEGGGKNKKGNNSNKKPQKK